MKQPVERSREAQIAELVRKACIQAARQGFEDAAMNGLCAEGALECALSAIQSLDLKPILRRVFENEREEGSYGT